MVRAAIVVIDSAGQQPAASLTRFSIDGTEVGDSWHETAEDAKAQAVFEFGESLGEWHPIPFGVSSEEAVKEQLRLHE
jgi:ABC-type nitrate/sulfonate/bicarbonate transport system substrate-binding protein